MIINNQTMHTQALADLSKNTSLFANLSDADLQEVLSNSTLQQYDAGQTLVNQGDLPKYIYFIVDGSVRTLRHGIDGDEATIRLLKPGGTCMEAVLFMGGPSPIAVQTVEDSRLLMIPGNFVKQLVLKNHQFATNLLQIVTYHYKNAIIQIDGMSTKKPVERVGYYFLQKHLEQGANSPDFELPFQKSTIANHLGITPETFSRALAQLKKFGLEVNGDKITLTDAFALCHYCDIDTAYKCDHKHKDNCHHCPLNSNEVAD